MAYRPVRRNYRHRRGWSGSPSGVALAAPPNIPPSAPRAHLQLPASVAGGLSRRLAGRALWGWWLVGALAYGVRLAFRTGRPSDVARNPGSLSDQPARPSSALSARALVQRSAAAVSMWILVGGAVQDTARKLITIETDNLSPL